MWKGGTYILKLPGLKGSDMSYYTRRRRKPEEGVFSRDSAVITAWLSKGHSDLHVSSPNQYALLKSEVFSNTGCNTNGSQPNSNKTISFTKPDYTKLAPWAKKHAQMHHCFVREKVVIGIILEINSMRKNTKIILCG